MTEPLREQAKVLSDAVVELAGSVDELDRRSTRTAIVQRFVIVGLVLDIILSVVVTIGAFALQSAIDREAKTRQEALCPLYSLIVGSYNPDTRAAGADRASYNAIFVEMRNGYVSLDCKTGVVPPRIEPTSDGQ